MNDRAEAIGRLERRLGHAFKDPTLIERALTHSSVRQAGRTAVRDYELLEFLGDRVIGLLVAERLAALYPDRSEGELTLRLHKLVDREACARVAREAEIGPALRLAGGETRVGDRGRDTILADACEAVLAAVFLDGGLEAARTAFLNLWGELLAQLDQLEIRDAKTALQEWAQGLGRPLPAYAVVSRTGPDHRPLFTVEVSVQGLAPEAADGASRQEAEKAAAAKLLAREGLR